MIRRPLTCRITCLAGVLALAALVNQGSSEARAAEQRDFLVELYVPDLDSSRAVRELIQHAINKRPGLRLRVVDLSADESSRQRFDKLCRYFRCGEGDTSWMYGCGQFVAATADKALLHQRLDQLQSMVVFVRSGCPHCADAKRWLAGVQPTYPGLKVVYRDLVSDRAAATEMQALIARYQKRAVSVPVFHFFGQLHVGFDRASTTGANLEQQLRKWSHLPRRSISRNSAISTGEWSWRSASVTGRTGRAYLQIEPEPLDQLPPEESLPLPSEIDALPLPFEDAASDELPLPGRAVDPATPAAEPTNEPQEVDLPIFGRVSHRSVGLPLFTIAIGLVDGFNPCAMWVLLFLLSILVNLKDRWKILAVAGTFVLVSGVVYFCFMAAWLNVFELIGLMRPAQVILALLALTIGLVHVKDFFALHRGVTFSIPEAAKPGIYARVRRIVMAEHLYGAVAGATVLAALVNIIELLCTAGLPALYTEILSLQQFPPWQDYLYLGLYNLAYMFDDAVMVGIVVVTLGRHKLQEHEGRWLKLVSGLVILTLGMVMLFKPDWLV